MPPVPIHLLKWGHVLPVPHGVGDGGYTDSTELSVGLVDPLVGSEKYVFSGLCWAFEGKRPLHSCGQPICCHAIQIDKKYLT